MVDEFEQWFSTHQQYFQHNRIGVDFTRRALPSPAAFATFESKSFVASITVWETGACDIHVLSYQTGEPVFAERHDLNSSDELETILEDAYTRITRND